VIIPKERQIMTM